MNKTPALPLRLTLVMAALAAAAACNGGVAGFDGARHNSPDDEAPDVGTPDVGQPDGGEPDAGPCGPGEILCGERCVDPQTDEAHCGGCDPCVAAPHSAALCQEGQCVLSCEGTFVDVDGDLQSTQEASNGCECLSFGAEACNGIDDDCDGQIDEDEGLKNACGGCRDLQGQPGEACAEQCGKGGQWACDGQDRVICQGSGNGCGGCDPLDLTPGDPCGECGLVECVNEDKAECREQVRNFFQDDDGDGFGIGDPVQRCEPEFPFTAVRAGDCDDAFADRNPGAVEACDEADNDCDDQIDEGVTNVCGGCEPIRGEPGDRCGMGECRGTKVCQGGLLICQGVGVNACEGCGELNGTPGDPCGSCGQLACEGNDALACQDSLSLFFRDGDGDGFGTSESVTACAPAALFTATPSGDCNDGDADIRPGRAESCNDVDDNCNNLVDEGVLNGCGGCALLSAAPGSTCTRQVCPGVYVCIGEDAVRCEAPTQNACGGCNGLNPLPGATCQTCGEAVCDGPEATRCDLIGAQQFFKDQDNDTYGLDNDSARQCAAQAPYTALRGGDCDDDDRSVNPDAFESCDGVDNDCDNGVDAEDRDLQTPDCALTQGVCEGSKTSCQEGEILDCTERDYFAFAEAIGQTFELQPEVLCDGVDNNCSGRSDENCCEQDSDDPRIPMPPRSVDGINQTSPGVALHPSGASATVVWVESASGFEGQRDDPPSIQLARYARQGGEVQTLATIPAPPRTTLQSPALSGHPLGIELTYLAAPGLTTALYHERLDHSWITATGGVQVATGITGYAVASRAAGSGVIVWGAKVQGLDSVKLRSIESNGALSNTVHTIMDVEVINLSVALSSVGGLVVGQSLQGGEPAAIVWRAIDLSGAPLGEPRNFDVRGMDSGGLAVAVTSNGQFLLMYAALNEDSATEIYTMVVNLQGEVRVEPTLIPGSGPGAFSPRLASLDDGVAAIWGETLIEATHRIKVARLDNAVALIGQALTPLSERILNAKGPLALATGARTHFDPQSQWFALASSEADDGIIVQPFIVRLSFHQRDGLPICFNE